MRDEMSARLEELRREFEVGQERLGQLELQEAELRRTLLRIGGAIQVLDELLGEGREAAPAARNGPIAAAP